MFKLNFNSSTDINKVYDINKIMGSKVTTEPNRRSQLISALFWLLKHYRS